ncbi:aminopeptidase P N-terminal domain-containing protein [Usitatibacter palustris]|uniref:Xaa-Pro aminopeptidase n=1 Tax=Usitatibacter palustris TaxID=2732487 RepID=A0A6M4H2Y2_9PROT|nr:aminopeptidase P N-terminal domain-containing protein [Usitatibacter palustris]QJR13685.1 Xaa-Pro aminopeptidase [Usitatibacter palustris]
MRLENPNQLKPFRKRRARVAAAAGSGVIVLPTAPERTRNADAHYDYRWDSAFFYLTGFREPEAVLVIVAGKKPREILFCREKNLEREIWDGFRYGPELAKSAFGFDEAYPYDQLDQRLPELLANQETLHTPVGADPEWDVRVTGWLNAVRAKVRTGISAPAQISDIRATVSDMRLIKDEHEIAIMRRAGEISSAAHVRAMRVAAPGKREYEVEAELIHEFIRNGARSAAYGSIVATGANACVLHYRENDAEIRKGDLMLIDAGCELDSYAADITRTFPVDGKFTAVQKDVYELVLASQEAAIKAVKPGADFIDYHDAATKVLVQGLIDFKLCKGSVSKVLEDGSYKQFYMHRTGHWLGLDVHDAGDYMRRGKWRKLEPGMVLTVEPGLYIRPAANVPKAFWNIGVRIEDDVLVTAKGRDVLTSACPKRVKDVEAAVRG